jgi:hypothetical protein
MAVIVDYELQAMPNRQSVHTTKEKPLRINDKLLHLAPESQHNKSPINGLVGIERPPHNGVINIYTRLTTLKGSSEKSMPRCS